MLPLQALHKEGSTYGTELLPAPCMLISPTGKETDASEKLPL